MNEHSLIRRIEADILDREHLKNPTFNLPHEVAARRLVKVFGDISRDMAPHWDAREYTWWVKSLSHCLRWAHQTCPTEATDGVSKNPDWKEQDESAAEILAWGIKYARLFNDHVAWSRGLLSATADEPSKTITFGDRFLYLAFVIDQQERDLAALTRDAVGAVERVDAIFRRWYPKIRWNTAEGLVYSPKLIPSLKEIDAVITWCRSLILPELEDSEPIGTYCVGDMRKFYACIYALSACVARLEDVADAMLGEEHLMGSWAFSKSSDKAIDWLSQCSGLPHNSTQSIIKDLSFDATRTHATLISQPFIPTNCGQLIFSPRLFSLANPQRMITAALTTGSGRNSYDRVSEKIEKWWINHIHLQLCAKHHTVSKEPTLHFHTGKKTPDFLVLDQQHKTLHVVEFKNYTPPLDVRAVCSRIDEFRKGVAQLQDYVKNILSLSTAAESVLGSSIAGFTVRGVLLIRHPMPLPIRPPEDVDIIDWQAMQISLDSSGSSFTEVVAKARPTQIDNADFDEQVIRVGRWKYRRILPVNLRKM